MKRLFIVVSGLVALVVATGLVWILVVPAQGAGSDAANDARPVSSSTVSSSVVGSGVVSGTPVAPGGQAVRIVAVGDTGLEAPAQSVFAGMGKAKPTVGLIVGDLSYVQREDDYCRMVNSRVSAPVEIIPGNHEGLDMAARVSDGDGVAGRVASAVAGVVGDGNGDGDISKFAACLPDRMGVTGLYPTDYFFDSGAVRVVMISPNIVLATGTRSYAKGTPELEWLATVIQQAKASGRWVVVAMHEPCLTVGLHACASSPDLTDRLIRERVDVVLAGHDHNYGRSHQLLGTASNPQVVDRDGSFVTSAGTVFVTVGNGGHSPRTINDLGTVWAAASGTNSPGGIDFGFGQLDITASRIDFQEVSTFGPRAGTVLDRFTIAR